MKKNRNVLHWSETSVRYHDVENGRWIDHQPVSEVSALVWCAANGVEFRKCPVRLVSVADVLQSSLKTKSV